MRAARFAAYLSALAQEHAAASEYTDTVTELRARIT